MSGRPKGQRSRAGDAGAAARRPRGEERRKITMWLPAELIRQLKHLAVDEGADLGRLAAPALKVLVGQRYKAQGRRDEADGAVPPRLHDAGETTAVEDDDAPEAAEPAA